MVGEGEWSECCWVLCSVMSVVWSLGWFLGCDVCLRLQRNQGSQIFWKTATYPRICLSQSCHYRGVSVWEMERMEGWEPLRGGCMFLCSLWQFTVVPLFLKNKLRCSPKFTFTEFPCSQKFRSMFPWSPKIFLTVPYNSSCYIFSWLVIFISFTSLVMVQILIGKTPLSPPWWPKNERNCNTLPIFCRRNGPFPSYTLKKFLQWSGNQCSLVPDYNSKSSLVP